jgi:RNA recognition motif-containing protein
MPVLFVGNLPYDAKSREVEDVFYKYGRIESVNVRSKGRDTFAFVEFSRQDDAEEALRRRDGYQFDDRHRIRVELSKGKGSRREDRDDRDRRDDDYRRSDRRDDDYRRADRRDDRRDEYRGRNDSDRNDNRDRRDNFDRRDRDYGRGRDDRQRRRRDSQPFRSEHLFKVTVDNIPQGMSWQDLKDVFKANESTASIRFADIKDGNGVVGFETREQAEAAIDVFHGKSMRNRSGDETTVSLTLQELPRSDEGAMNREDEDSRPDDRMDSREESRDRSRSRGSPRYDD